jgi:hypothetical protein
MRNQGRFLQKYETQNTYVPNFNSDLYIVKPPEYKQPLETADMHPMLFEQYTFANKYFDPAIGQAKFNNPTRTQLRK